MKLDKTNISIIKAFYYLKEGETISLSEIRNKIFPKKKGVDKTKLIIFLRDRLHNMPKEIFEIKKNGRFWEYRLIKKNVILKSFSFPDRVRKGIGLKIDDKWNIKEL